MAVGTITRQSDMAQISRPAAANTRGAPQLDFVLLLLCFLLSGVAALVYQTAWTREFGLLFGTSELAVATVLAAYMGGLALGARLIEPLLPRIRRYVRTYALLEIGIAASAIVLVPALLAASGWLLVQWFGGQPQPPSSEQLQLPIFYLAAAFIALLIPTTLMGATLPVLARHAVLTDAQIGSRIGLLYAVNTAGAVAGALLTAYFLLPELGLQHTTWAAAALNALVFLLVASLVQRSSESGPAAAAAAPQPAAPFVSTWTLASASWILPLMLLSGAVSFFYEVLWTRLLSHLIGGSIHAFAVMLASFLAGIALGGGLGAWLARSRDSAVIAFMAAQAAVALAAAAAYGVLLGLAPYNGGLTDNSWTGFLLLLPMTIAIGTTFPLAVRILSPSPAAAAAASARVYAWNTVGAIVGAIAGGFWLIPLLRYEGSARLGVAASLALGVAALWLLLRPRLVMAAALTVVAVAAALLFQPQRPQTLLLTSPLRIPNNGRVLYYEVGRSASVVVLAQDGGLVLRTNGLPEAMMDTPGQAPRFSGEFWLAPLASIMRPEARDMLVIGYGGGVVVEGVAPNIRNIDVIELEPKVIDANRATEQLRRRNPLNDPRLHLIVNDARGALQLSARKYDVIVSQPSHPWTAGASHLYTLEFMSLAREHLNDDGVFIQWMNVAFVNESLLRSLTNTLQTAFGQVRIYRPDPFTLVFAASTGSLAPEQRLLATGVPLSVSPAHFARYGIGGAEDLVFALAADEEGAARLAQGAALITDDRNRIATSTVFNAGSGLSAEQAGRLLAAYDPLQNPDSWVYKQLGGRLAFDYIIRRNANYLQLDRSLRDRVQHIIDALGPGPDARLGAWYLRRAQGDVVGAQRMAHENAELAPDHAASMYIALQPEVTALRGAEPPAELAAEIARLPDSARATLLGTGFAARSDYQGLAALDPVLATAAWTDTWRLDATMLRADWRARVANSDRSKGFADQALEMLDRDAMFTPSPATFGLRLTAAVTADRPAVALEAVDSLVSWDLGLLQRPLSAPMRQRIRARLTQLQPVLEQKASDPRLDPARGEEVREKLRQAVALATAAK